MYNRRKNVKVIHLEILTTVEKFFIRLVLTMSNAITSQLIINAFTISTFKLRINVASRIFS